MVIPDAKWRGPLEIDESDLNALPISKAAMELLIKHAMPGNYRQLCSVIRNAWVKTKQRIEVGHLSAEILSSDAEITPSEAWLYLPEDEFRKRIDDIEKKRITHFLQETKGNVSKAARLMVMKPHKLFRYSRLLNLVSEEAKF